jgi:hypothetical protein
MPLAAEASIFIDATIAQCVGAGRRLTRSVPSREFTRRIMGGNLLFIHQKHRKERERRDDFRRHCPTLSNNCPQRREG